MEHNWLDVSSAFFVFFSLLKKCTWIFDKNISAPSLPNRNGAATVLKCVNFHPLFWFMELILICAMKYCVGLLLTFNKIMHFLGYRGREQILRGSFQTSETWPQDWKEPTKTSEGQSNTWERPSKNKIGKEIWRKERRSLTYCWWDLSVVGLFLDLFHPHLQSSGCAIAPSPLPHSGK